MLDSWTLELANWLMSEKDMERRAFRSVAAERKAEISLSSNCLDHTADCDESISNQSTMTNIDETMNKIDSLLADRGLTSEYKEQAVRQLLYHLYIALDIYRYMTYSEKNKAGYWYRMFRSSFSLTGFLKERKRKRDKEKSPLHHSYKERETELKEKAQKMCLLKGRESGGLEVRQKAYGKSELAMLNHSTFS
jgi:hypothetical protein